MNQRKCLKCGHATQYETVAPEACNSCGAVYHKVEEAMRGGPASRPAPSRAPAYRPPPRNNPIADYAEAMRSDSLYPTWRELVKWATWLGYLIAALVTIGGVIALKEGHIKSGGGALAAAVFIVILARVWRELSLMVADLADASVRQASNTERLIDR
jgi:hypothetical protein